MGCEVWGEEIRERKNIPEVFFFFWQEALALESKLVEQMKALQDVNESDSAGSSMHGGLMSWINDAMPWWPDVVD